MAFLELLGSNQTLFLVCTTLLGLAVGSFLNVVIHRLPLMMEREWTSQCHEFLEIDGDGATAPDEAFNLILPASACPNCQHKIGPLENIPIVSFIFLGGKCSECKTPISMRYPAVELVTAVLSFVVAWQLGFGWQAAAALLLTWALIALSLIDFDHQLLPDSIVFPVLWLGLVMSISEVFVDAPTSIIGAAVGYLSLWSVFHLFKLITGKEGMGHGDFKLLALFGAWLGWQSIIQIILLSSVVGAVVGIALIVALGRDKNVPIPFGPYIAAAGWISLLWGEQINTAYLQWTGMG